MWEGFGHIACHYRNGEEEGSIQMPSNKFKMLKSRVIQKGEESGGEVRKDIKEISREERVKRRVEMRQMKVERKEKKKKLLKEVTVKIGLK